ncbi:MAG: L-erythro-3,5-diaminohexanoate dehydrogenase [Clostridia bacterium]|nr:L-erythro-3,5-diaminohexanoate dehydrogenase [Clostridia bacterium]
MELKGNKYGTHRVLEPVGVMPQTAQRINNSFNQLYSNEIVCDVISLNIDSASFTQLKKEANMDEGKIAAKIMEIVSQRGKMQNPVTGSGGMFIGRVAHIGSDLVGKIDLEVGDKIASLVSLSLTPLCIKSIDKIHINIDRVDVTAKAVIFESGIYAKLPSDMTEQLALAALDVAGAPAQTRNLVKEGDSVLVLGAGGKSGILVCYEAKKKAGKNGRVVGVVRKQAYADTLMELGVVDSCILASADQPVEVLEKSLEANNGCEYDVAVNCVNVQGTEMASILPVRDGGIVYFFSMATSFTRAALGAEGVGKDVNMIIGNGYTKNHAEITLNVLRESPGIRKLFQEKYI